MFLSPYIILWIISLICLSVKTQYTITDVPSNHLYPHPQIFSITKPRILADQYLMRDKIRLLQADYQTDKVNIQVFYECLCPDCRHFDISQFIPTVKKIGEHLDIHVYPYGNANTIVHPNGSIEIECQHGQFECYGNMLHACAIDNLSNFTAALYFNSCMMDFSQNNGGSDDEAADKCGIHMQINTEPIKSCAKSSRGLMLLKSYGDYSKKVGFRGVPYILINGAQNYGEHFMHDVCRAFRNPPPECN